MNTRISRRTVLRGLGASMALPWLECMGTAARASIANPTGTPVRLGCLFMANGVRDDKWTPTGAGQDFELSPILSPLARHKDQINVFTELMNSASLGGDGHYAKTANWLTGTQIAKTTGKDLYCGGVSLDQVVAQKWGHLTKLSSLELSTDPVTTGVDLVVNYTRLYGSHIAWRTPNTPLPGEINPQAAFDRLFRGDKPNAQRASEDQSVLDLVLDDAHRLRGQLGRSDQTKLDEYLESVRSVERRIEFDLGRVKSGENLDPSLKVAIADVEARLAKGEVDAGGMTRFDHTEHSRLMLDLMVLAFWSDSTRVSTFMFGHAVSTKNFSFLEGVQGSHHDLSHHGKKPDKLDQYQKINTWHVEQLAYMLDKMRAIKEGDGTLLDHTLLLFGSSLRDGNSHNPRNLPMVLAGGGKAGVTTGQHVVSPKSTPLCNLYLSMLDKLAVPAKAFGDSTGRVAEMG